MDENRALVAAGAGVVDGIAPAEHGQDLFVERLRLFDVVGADHDVIEHCVSPLELVNQASTATVAVS
jgi:hypothetical protein